MSSWRKLHWSKIRPLLAEIGGVCKGYYGPALSQMFGKCVQKHTFLRSIRIILEAIRMNWKSLFSSKGSPVTASGNNELFVAGTVAGAGSNNSNDFQGNTRVLDVSVVASLISVDLYYFFLFSFAV